MTKIIDGGNSTYARELGYNLCSLIWSGNIACESPEIVEKVHQDFINSGSRYITTFNYSCTPFYNSKKNFNYFQNIKICGELANNVKLLNQDKNITVLGCIPPYGESYSIDKVKDKKNYNNFYEKCVKLLEPNIDIFLCETLSTLDEAKCLVDIIRSISQKPIWISFSTHNKNTLRCGADIRSLPEILEKWGVSALLFNCTPIYVIDEIILNLKDIDINIEIGVYPNLHNKIISNDFCLENETDDPHITYLEISLDDFSQYCKKWINNKVTIIGGCCGIGPKYIEKIIDLS